MTFARVLLFLLVSSAALAQRPLLDDFRSYPDGSDGTPTWHVVKGEWQVLENFYYQRSSEYDCVSMLTQYMDASFELEAAFEHVQGDPGVGLVFAARRYDEIGSAQMARFDGGETFLAGYFQNGEFTGTASTKSLLLQPGVRHTLLLRVDRSTGSWSIRLDGTPIFNRELPLHYAGGYVGLQSSAGAVRFSRVALRRLERGPKTELDWTERLSYTPSGDLISVNSRRGDVLRQGRASSAAFGRTASGGSFLDEPVAAAPLDSTRLVVVDRRLGRIHRVRYDGTWEMSAGWKGSQRGALSDPSAVAVGPGKKIFVAERAANRVQVFDDSLRSIAEFGKDLLSAPSDIASWGDDIFVLNTGLCQVEWYAWNGKRAAWKRSIPFGGGEAHGIAVWKDTLFVSVVNEVRSYGLDGAHIATFLGRSIGFLFPQGLAVDSSGRLSVADFVGGRIVTTDTRLCDPSPQVRFTSGDSTSAEIVWTSPFASDGIVRLALPDGSGREFRERGKSTSHRVTLSGLRPATTYHYTIPAALPTTEGRSPRAGIYSFTTPSAPKTMQYSRIRMAAILFTNVTDEKNSLPPGVSPVAVSEAEIARIKGQILDGARFYWMQTGMRFHIDVDFLVVTEPLRRSDVYGTEWWYPPKEEVLQRVLAAQGREMGAYASFLYLTCTQAYDTTLRRLVLAGKGGGFTNGVGTGKGYGISWWDVTRKDHNAGNNWLMVHEFNHQLDDIFMVSGYPEYWFNHISPTIGTAGPFGEHFDANAFILRMVPGEEWTDLRYTSLLTARDADQDGIPDEAPELPMDEARLGSDSLRQDTDRDGVPDLSELRASNWVTEGWGETYGGARIFPNPAIRDADGDGVSDGTDPAPCTPSHPVLHQLAEGMQPEERQLLARLDDPLARADLSAWWSDSALSFRLDLDTPRTVKIMVDAGADGWFLGRGNYLLVISPDTLMNASVNAQIFNAMSPTSWPFMDKTLSDTLRIRSTMSPLENGRRRLTVSLPRSQFLGLDLRAGLRLGLLIGIQCAFGEGMKRYVNIWEPNRFFNVRLAK